MPNKVTGYTDTTGAMSIVQKEQKVALVLAHVDPDAEGTIEPLTVFDALSSTDILVKMGPKSVANDVFKIFVKNKVTTLKVMALPTVVVDGEVKTEKEAYEIALDKSLELDIDFIVCTDNTTPVITAVKDHLDIAESEDKERYAVFSTDTADVPTLGTFGSSINHSRIFAVGTNVVDSNAVKVPHYLLASAVTAQIIANINVDPALPMNGVELLGFGGVEKVLKATEIQSLIQAGVVPITRSPGGRPVINRLVTTYTKDTQGNKDGIWQEGTTRFIADDVLSSVRSNILTNYKRCKNVTRILDAIRTSVIGILQTKNDLEIIENFDKNTVVVYKDPEDLYGAIIEYDFDVVTPLYTVQIRQHMKL